MCLVVLFTMDSFKNETNGTCDNDTKSSVQFRNIVLIVVYLFVGIIGVTANFTVVYVKTRFRKDFNNVTYNFMVQLAINDGLALTGTALCSSFFLMFPNLARYDVIEHIFGYNIVVCWYTGSCFLCLISFSRFVSVTRNDKVKVYFSKWATRAMIGMPWMVCLLWYSPLLWFPDGPIFVWYPIKFTWDFDLNYWLSGMYDYQNLPTMFFCFVWQITFNGLTLWWLRKTRHNVITLDQSKNRKRERKLFFQCLVNSCLHIGTVCFFVSLTLVLKTYEMWAFLCLAAVWNGHHFCNPIIYFILNKKLREHVWELYKFDELAKIVGMNKSGQQAAEQAGTTNGKSNTTSTTGNYAVASSAKDTK